MPPSMTYWWIFKFFSFMQLQLASKYDWVPGEKVVFQGKVIKYGWKLDKFAKSFAKKVLWNFATCTGYPGVKVKPKKMCAWKTVKEAFPQKMYKTRFVELAI